MPNINVDWFKDNPVAIAKMERKRRQLGALSQVAGGVTTDVQRYGAFRQSEDLAEANQARLAERLNYADAQARASGRPLEEGQAPPASAMSPGMLGPTPPAPSGGSAAALSGTAPSAQPSSIREDPLGPSKRSGPISSLQTPPVSGLPEEGGLSKFARTAAATLFGANIPRPGRMTNIGRMTGAVERRRDELLALRATNPLWRYAVNPATGMRQVAPDWNIPDMERIPGAGMNNKPTEWTTLDEYASGSPHARKMLEGHRDYIQQPFPMGGETQIREIYEEMNPETGQWEEKTKPPAWKAPKPGIRVRTRKVTDFSRRPGDMPPPPEGGAPADPGAQFGIPFLR